MEICDTFNFLGPHPPAQKMQRFVPEIPRLGLFVAALETTLESTVPTKQAGGTVSALLLYYISAKVKCFVCKLFVVAPTHV